MSFFLRKRDALTVISQMDWGLLRPSSPMTKSDHWCMFYHDLQTAPGIKRAISFAAGRINWYNAYLKNAFPHHQIVFDDIGQNICVNITQAYPAKAEALCGRNPIYFGGETAWLIIFWGNPPQKSIGKS